MIKTGFNLLAWSATLTDDLKGITERLAQIGYDGVELFIDGSDLSSYRDFGEHLKGLGLEATCVIGLGPEENPASPDRAIRLQAADTIREFIDRAAELDAKLIGGPLHSAFATFTNEAPHEAEYDWSAEVLRSVTDYAVERDVELSIEAINRFECYLCNTVEQMTKLVRKVDHPNVTAHFDTHHANLEEKSIIGAIHEVSPVLGHFHISENDRGTPGDGHIPWDDVFAALKEIRYDRWLTIEAFTRNDPAFANSINVWREYSPPWEAAEKGYQLITRMLDKHGLQSVQGSTDGEQVPDA